MISTPKTCFTFALLLLATCGWSAAQESDEAAEERARGRSPNNPSMTLPDKTDEASRRPPRGSRGASFPGDLRTIDGFGNNRDNPAWGSANVEFLRVTALGYGDDVGSPSGEGLASAREVSNFCVAQLDSQPNRARASDFLWQWGQFLDHDLDLTPEVEPAEAFDVAVPAGDVWFDPFNTGEVTIPLNRALYNEVDGIRQQINVITAYIDASNVYGSDEERAQTLRTLDGTGRLATSAGDLLPFNTTGLPNAAPHGADPSSLFLAGDFRANEQVGLTAMHTLFLREHNLWADTIRASRPELDGDAVYQRARAMVAAELQAITYREFLPMLLGRDALSPYRGYREQVDAGIANVFATAAYRFGHSMLSGELQRLDDDGEVISAGNLSLADAFFSPEEIINQGIDPLLRGLASQRAQEIDNQLVDEVRNFLFGPPGSGGFDLASLNIQRGRDHGMPSYNQVRVAYGLEPVTSFDQIHPDTLVQANLASVYDTVDDIEIWVGGLAERHVRGAMVGETFRTILIDQFERLRDGDSFWYQSYLPGELVQVIERQTLARIIRRNTEIGSELGDDPFRVRRLRDDQ